MRRPSAMTPFHRGDSISPRAFTLIELLIVVAIIAILAAIAVPNFLEAQTRSKVSRAKADMRTVATALEAYHIDNNRYPAAHAESGFGVDSRYRTINPRIRRLVPITTPIAYISSVPRDVFNVENHPTWDNDAVQTFLYADRRSYEEFVPAPYGPGTNGANIYRILWAVQFPQSEWLLRSRGPVNPGTGVESALGNSVDARDAYDPTNGTVSTGNIFYLGPGVGPLN